MNRLMTMINFFNKIKDYIKLYRKVSKICKQYHIKKWHLTFDELLVDVKQDVNLNSQLLESLPMNFGKIQGSFNCISNRLKNLKGAPHIVFGNFTCSDNLLTNLAGAPLRLYGSFDCSNNLLTTLQGGPEYVSGDFKCMGNKLETMSGAPLFIGRSVNCNNNKLKTLNGLPESISGHVICTDNELRDISSAPRTITGDFACFGNPIIHFKGAPTEVGGYYRIFPIKKSILLKSSHADCVFDEYTENIPIVLIEINQNLNKDFLRYIFGDPALNSYPLDGWSSIYGYQQFQRKDLIRKFLELQDDFMIWEECGTLNEERFDLLVNYIK